MNYREKMRKAIECPQFGNIDYGEWGTLRLDQRKNIKRLLDEMDRADEVIKHQFFKIERLQNIINIENDYITQLHNLIYKTDNPTLQFALHIKQEKYLKELKEGDKE